MIMDYSELAKENERLRTMVERYHKEIKEVVGGNTSEVRLREYQVRELQNAITPLTLSLLRRINKNDLIVIILNRETCLYDTIHGFEKTLKVHDREVFRNQRNEIDRLRNLLIDNSPLYNETLRLKEKIKELKKLYGKADQTRHMLYGQLHRKSKDKKL